MIGIGKVMISWVTPMNKVFPITSHAMSRLKKRVKFSMPHHAEKRIPLFTL